MIRSAAMMGAGAVLLLGISVVALSAQTDPREGHGCRAGDVVTVGQLGGSNADLARISDLMGWTEGGSQLRRRSSRRWARPDLAAFLRTGVPARCSLLEPAPVATSSVWASDYPVDGNDGSLWAGRGLSMWATAGATARLGPLTASVQPKVIYQQNEPFQVVPIEVGGHSEFTNPYYPNKIDLPQRMGRESFWTLDPGQTYVRVDGLGMKAGVSLENLWWGPGSRYSILLSHAAGGFPHLFFGTRQPVETAVGTFEADGMWGRLRESSYFDSIPENDEGVLVAYGGSYSPRWLTGLYLGVAQLYHYDPSQSDLGFRDYFPFLYSLFRNSFVSEDDPKGGSQPGNQLAAVYARWVLPESGFEAYGSWAHDDSNYDFEDLFEEPDHSQAYLLGVQKVTQVGDRRLLRVLAELIHLQEMRPLRSGRGVPVYYTHGTIRQGHTHRGQSLGSFTGPGSDAQYVTVDLFSGDSAAGMRPSLSRIGLFFERIRRNEMSSRAIQRQIRWPYEHDVELTVGLRPGLSFGAFRAEAELAYSHRWNRDYLKDDSNVRISLDLAWWPGSGD